MITRRKMVIANRKMNGNIADNQRFIDMLLDYTRHHHAQYVICPPHPYLYQAQSLLENTHIAWGGQNMSRFAKGAYTGSVSPAMLKEFGCQYVIIGHSERRTRGHDTDESCGERFEVALQMGLTPILCIGETLEEYQSGETDIVVARQLNPVISHVGVEALAQGIIAYEPVWAIGTGIAASPQHAQSILSFIRGHICLLSANAAEHVSLLYGGSVNASNATQLLKMPDIDGSLVGGASLVIDDFVGICDVANNLSSQRLAA